MKIDLSMILTNKADTMEISENISFDGYDLDSVGIKKIENVSFKGFAIRHTSGCITIDGSLAGTLYLSDDVTLEEVKRPFAIRIIEKLDEFGKNEDGNLEIIQNRVDILDFLWQNIVVEIPLKISFSDNEKLITSDNLDIETYIED